MLAGAVAVVIVLVAAVVGGSFYMLGFSLTPDPNRWDNDSAYNVLFDRVPDMRPWVDSLRERQLLRDTTIRMDDGRRAHALFVRCDTARGRTAIVIHGYKDQAIKFLYLGRMYQRDLGCNILLPDLSAHGSSDGDVIQMGWDDRLDVLRWISEAKTLFSNGKDSVRMVIHGVSMGAATTMCVAGEPTPACVRCFVEDCGYTSVWDEFECELRDQFGLPAFPMLYMSSALTKLRYGWSFGEASPLRQVAKSRLPMLFIHGDADDYVPTWMVYPLFKAKVQPIGKDGKVDKELWIAKGTQHALAFHDYPEEYSRRVREFVTRCVGR